MFFFLEPFFLIISLECCWSLPCSADKLKWKLDLQHAQIAMIANLSIFLSKRQKFSYHFYKTFYGYASCFGYSQRVLLSSNVNLIQTFCLIYVKFILFWQTHRSFAVSLNEFFLIAVVFIFYMNSWHLPCRWKISKVSYHIAR